MRTIYLAAAAIAAALAAAPAYASGANRCTTYTCGVCCSQDTVPCCASVNGGGGMMPAYTRRYEGTDGMAGRVLRVRERMWKADEVAAFTDHYVKNARSYAANAPSYSSAFAIGGSGITEATGSAMDSAGNVVVTGGFQGAIVFPTSPAPTTLTSTGDFDVFVAKFTTGGQCLWARVAHGPTNLPAGFSLNASLAVAVDGANNTYFGGGFVGTLTFVNGSGGTAATLSGGSVEAHFESFLAKYDSAGVLLWARGGQSGMPGSATDLIANINGLSRVAVDATGNVFAAGTVSATSLLGKAVPYVPYAAFGARIDPATGIPLWAVVTQNDGVLGVVDLTTDGHGGAYALVWSEGSTITFPTAPNPTILSFDPYSVDTFVTHFDANGTCLFAKQPGSGEFIFANGLAASPAGDVYLSGMAWGLSQFDQWIIDPGIDNFSDVQMLLVKYDANGVTRWVRASSGTGYAFGDRVTVDGGGNAYLVGWYSGNLTLTGNPSSPGLSITTGLDEDVFLAQFDAAGTPKWLRAISSPGIANAGYSGSDTAPIYVDSASLYYHAPTQTVMTTGDFVGTMFLDASTQLHGNGSCRYSFAAMWPASGVAPAAAAPALRIALAAADWTGPNSFYVDFAITNTGFGNALNTQMTTATLKMLLGSGTVTLTGPALPAAIGTIAPSATVTQRVYATLSSPAGTHRVSLAPSFTTQSATGTRLSTAYSTALTIVQ